MAKKKQTPQEITSTNKKLETEVKQEKKKLTTTKKILWLSWILFIILIIFCILGYEVGIAMEVVGGIVTAVTTSFYLWKSRCENREKIALGMIDELAEKYGIENVISILENILRD